MTEPQPEMENDEAPEADVNANVAAENDTAGQIAGLKDQVLRALAEAENTRRRAQKEREDTAKYAVANFAKEMLNVADNFRRALEAVPKDIGKNDALKNLIEGIDATERQLHAA